MHVVYTYASQEVAESVKVGLDRPACLKDSGFVHPDTQCPKKPKGRKKKASNKPEAANKPEPSASSRPSAAALGFSTEGLTDKEVETKRREALEETQVQAPKRRRGRKAPEAEHIEVEVAPKRTIESEAASSSSKPSKAAKVDKPAATAKGSKRQASKAPKEDANINKDGPEDTSARKPKKTRNARVKKSDFARDDNDVAPSTAEASGGPSVEAPVVPPMAAEVPNDCGEEQGGDQDGNGGENDEAAQAIAAKKAKASRKSSAYHRAAAEAKRRGLSREEQKEAGKAVSW